MYKKIISSLLVVALLNLVGCYSNVIVTPNQYKKELEKGEVPSEIIVRLHNLKLYRFAIGRYVLKEDSLYGEGFELVNNYYQPFKGTIPLIQIQSIQFEKKDTKKTNSMVYGMVLLGLIIIITLIVVEASKDIGEGLGRLGDKKY